MRKLRTAGRLLLAGLAGAVGAGAMAAQIVVGQVAPLSGLDAAQGRAYATGLQLAFDQANKAGGAGGNTFSLVRVNASGKGDVELAATEKLLSEHKPQLLAGFFGTGTLNQLASSKLLDREKIALVGIRANEVQRDVPNLYHVRAGLRDELQKIFGHLATVGITRLALFHEEGPTAGALLAAADEVASKTGAQLVVKASYPTGSGSVGPALQKLQAANPQAIVMVSSGAAAAALVESYLSAGGKARFYAVSEVDVQQLLKRLGDEHLQGVSIAQVVPSPYKLTSRLNSDFNAAVAKAGNLEVPVSHAMMEGYIAGRVIVEAARRAGGRASREGLMAALDNLSNFDLGGYLVNFQPGQRSGSRFVELSIVSSDGKVRQ